MTINLVMYMVLIHRLLSVHQIILTSDNSGSSLNLSNSNRTTSSDPSWIVASFDSRIKKLESNPSVESVREQVTDLHKEFESFKTEMDIKLSAAQTRNSELKKANAKIVQDYAELKEANVKIVQDNTELKEANAKIVQDYTNLRTENAEIRKENMDRNNQLVSDSDTCTRVLPKHFLSFLGYSLGPSRSVGEACDGGGTCSRLNIFINKS